MFVSREHVIGATTTRVAEGLLLASQVAEVQEVQPALLLVERMN